MANRWYEAGYSGSASAGKTLKLHIYTIATDIVNNRTTERADLWLIVTNTTGGWWNNYGSPAYVGINGNNTTQTVAWDARSTGDKLLIGSWDTVIQHDDNGKKSIGVSASHNTNLGLGSASIADTYECDTIPRASTITLTPNKANIGETIEVKIGKKSNGFRHTLTFSYGNSNIKLAENVDSNYYFGTSQYEDLIYSKISNANSGWGKIICDTYNGTTKIGSSEARIDLYVVDANPIFNNFTFKDTNSKTVALTGSDKILVNGYSNVLATISQANKAAAQKYASMSKYRLQIGTKQVDADYSENEDVSMCINNIDSNSIRVYAIDTRGNSTIKDLSPDEYILYNPITITNLSASRGDGGVSTEVTLNLKGNIWNNNFGEISNSIKSAKVQYKYTNSNDWNDCDILNPTVTDNTFEITTLIKGDLGVNGFSIEHSYDIQVVIEDELSSYTTDTTVGSGSPAMAIAPGGVALGGLYDESVGGNIQGIYEIGDIFLSFSSTNPSKRFGGTWELVAKGRTLVGVDENDTDFATAKKTGGSKFLQSHTHTMKEAGKHSHIVNFDQVWNTGGGTTSLGTVSGGPYGGSGFVKENGNHSHEIESSGTGDSGNLQPYLTCYIWERVA